MAASNVRDAVRDYVVDSFLFGQADRLGDDESFLESGIIDSTGVLELVGFLETTFGFTVADDELIPANLDSVSSICRFVERKLQKRDG